MSVLKKVTTAILALVLTLAITLFCLLFTAPGNQFIAYSVSKLVDGLTIEINQGRFLYNDPFNVSFENDTINFNAKQLKLDLFWWQCDGVCIDNLTARTIQLSLAESPATEEQTPSEPLSKISFPFNIAVQNIAINEFTLHHASADVQVNNFTLAAKAEGSTVAVQHLTVKDVLVHINEQPATSAKAQQSATNTLSELPALPDIEFNSPLNLQLEQFAVNTIHIEQGEQRNTIENIALSLAVENDKFELKTLTAQYQQWQLHSAMSSKISGNLPLRGEISITGEQHQANLSLSGDLSQLAIKLQTAGQYPLAVTAQANLKQKNYPFALTATIEQWFIDTQTEQLKVSNVALSAQGDANDYSLNFNALSQLGAYPEVTLSSAIQGTLTQAQLTRLTASANDSSTLITGHVDWQQGIKAQFSGALNNVKAQYFTDTLSTDISGQFEGQFNSAADHWQLQMDNTQLSGTVEQAPVELVANFSLNDSLNTKIDSLYLTSGNNSVRLRGSVNDVWQLDGNVTLKSEQHAHIPFIANGNAEIKVTGERLTPAVDLSLLLDNFIYQDINISTVKLKGQLDTAADWQTDVSLKVAKASIAEQLINSIAITASGDKTDHQAIVAIDAEQGLAEVEVTGKLNDAIWSGVFSHVTLSDKKLHFSNSKKIAVKVNTQNADFDVSEHCWQSNNSTLCINALAQKNNVGQLDATLNQLALEELKHVLPDNIRVLGNLQGEFAVNWQQGTLKNLRAKLNSSELVALLSAEENRFRLPIETLNISAYSDPKMGKLEANLASSVLGNIAAQMQIDDIQNQQSLTGNIAIDKILLSDLQPFLDTLEQLKGEIGGKIALAGTLSEPLLSGELNVSEINLEGEQLPVVLSKSNINVVFDKTTASVIGHLNDSQGGHIKLSGDVNWQDEQPAISMKVVGEQFFVRAQPDVTFKVSPKLTLNLANNALKLDGEVRVPYGRIMIEELPEGAVQVSDDEIIVDQQSKSTDKVPFDYDVNLTVIVNNDVKIESFGLESKIAGDLTVKMSQGTPIIATGELNLIDGTYLAFGQDLIIKTGQIGFSGSVEQPFLNIKAIRNPDTTANDVIAGVTLTGNVEQPTLKVFSEPTMDQAQALAYLLNGQPLGEGNSSSDAMLTQLLLSQGVSRSEGVVSKVGEKIGLSDVSLSSTGSGDSTKLEISGYLAPSLQVKYSVGVFDSLSEVAIRYQLLTQFYVEVTSGLNQNVDLLYKFDWD